MEGGTPLPLLSKMRIVVYVFASICLLTSQYFAVYCIKFVSCHFLFGRISSHGNQSERETVKGSRLQEFIYMTTPDFHNETMCI